MITATPEEQREQQLADYIRALGEERSAYERSGRGERVPAVDAELERARGELDQLRTVRVERERAGLDRLQMETR